VQKIFHFAEDFAEDSSFLAICEKFSLSNFMTRHPKKSSAKTSAFMTTPYVLYKFNRTTTTKVKIDIYIV
jgi:hypothetical protein